jgi:peptidoglycan/LPS O-acetylase OafA/YrhL
VLPLALARIFLMPHHPSTHNFVNDLYNHAQYAVVFALGWLSRTPWAAGLWPLALRTRWLSLALCIASWAALVAYFGHYADTAPPEALQQAERVLWAAFSWWAILAACGWAQRAFPTESPRLRAASAAVFCLYVLHQSVIVLLTRVLLPLDLPWGLEAMVLMGLTVAVCAAAYLVLRRVPGLRLMVGIAPERASQRTPAVG